MEGELGLKLTRAADDFTSDFLIMKDRSGSVFLSRETDAMFILSLHLKGYKRENIRIDIYEDGNLIAICGKRHVKETIMVGSKVYKSGSETREFEKVFKIPGGVILDEIKANYNEDESTLKITMPKKVKGIRGMKIEEVEGKHELMREGSVKLKVSDEKESSFKNMWASLNQENGKKVNEMLLDKKMTDKEKGVEKGESIQEIFEPKRDVNGNDKRVYDDGDGVREEERLGEEKEGPFCIEPENNRDHTPRGKRCKICVPIVAGSTLLLSLMVFVFQMIRSKNQNRKRKD